MGQNKKSREGLKEEEVREGLCVMWKKKNVGNFRHLAVLYWQANYPTAYVSLKKKKQENLAQTEKIRTDYSPFSLSTSLKKLINISD